MKASGKFANNIWTNLPRRCIALALYRPHSIFSLVVSIDVNTAIAVAGSGLVNYP